MAVTAYGITFDFGGLSCSPKIIDVDWDGRKVESIDPTHQGTADGERTYMSGSLKDNGSFKLTIEWAADDQPPVGSDSADTYSVTWPVHESGHTQGAKDEFDAFIEEASGNFKLGEKMVQTITIKVAGKITHTAES